MKQTVLPLALVISLFTATPPSQAQALRFGAKVGISMTNHFDDGQFEVRGGTLDFSSTTSRFMAGPSIEWQIRPRVSLELDALYRPIGYVRSENTTVSGVTLNSSLETTGSSWSFPALAKYRWHQDVSPYVSGGLVLRYLRPSRVHGSSTVQTAAGTVTTQVDTTDAVNLFAPGAVVAVGVEFGGDRIRVMPEVRYSRWGRINVSGPLHLAPNQVEFLFGFLF